MTKQLFHKGQIARQDLLIGLAGSLGKIGEIVNRPETQIEQSSSFGYSQNISTATRDPDILGAALEGFFNPLADSLRQRSNRIAQDLSQHGNVVIVPSGTEVSVFVNTFFKVRR